MIFGIEIALIVFGLSGLFAGKFKVGKEKELVGIPARLLGLLCLMPIPVSLLLVTGYMFHLVGSGVPAASLESAYKMHFVGIEAAVAIGTALVVTVGGNLLYRRQEEDAQVALALAPSM